MKFRMLILAVAVMAMASLSFGQGSQFNFKYYSGGTQDWIPLYYDCNPEPGADNPVLQDGLIVRIMWDRTPASISISSYNDRLNPTSGCYSQGYEVGDIGYPIGEDGNNHQILPTNEFAFNSAEIPAVTGGFLSPLFEFRGGRPKLPGDAGFSGNTAGRMYLSIGCWMDEAHTVWNSMYSSRDYILIDRGYSEMSLNNFICANHSDPSDPFYCDPEAPEDDVYYWNCEGVCVPPVNEECEGYSDSLFIPWNHNDVNESCHNLCLDEDNVTHIFVGPFANYCVALYPESGGLLNVLSSENCTSTDCPDGAAEFIFNPSIGGNWIEVDGHWYRHFEVTIIEPGCVTIVLELFLSGFSWDCWLPVELLSFEAVPGDRQVTLHWTTASETDNDHFDIERDGAIAGRITAANTPTGDTYNWSESNLINGREYTYSLVSVSTTGEREVIGTTSATPSMNAATITEYALHQNYPNPFNPETAIAFDIVESGIVTLTVYNSTGQTVATLVNGTMTSGRHSVTFDAASLPSGLYFYRLNAGEFTSVKKMVLMK